MTEGYFELPASWAWVRVRDAGLVQLGRQRSPEHHSGEHMRPYLRVANVYENRIDTRDVLAMNFTPAETERYLLEPGDILLNEGQSRELVGRPAMFRGEVPGACFQNTLVRFRAIDGVTEPAYALSVFRFYLRAGHFQNICKWTTNIAHLGAERFAEMPFPLAPLPEQKRIADKLDALFARVDACRERLDRVPGILKRFRQSVLAAATSGELTRESREERGVPPRARGNLPPTWRERAIGDLGAVQLGRQRSPKFHSGDSMRPYLRVQNVFEDRIDLSDVMEMDFPPEDFRRYELHPGDILLNEGQSPHLLGRPAMYRGELPGACFTNTLIRFQANRALVLPEYALLVFRHHMHSGRYAAEGNITTNIAHLGAGRFAAVEFPLPPLDEQAEVVRRASTLLDTAHRLEHRLDLTVALADRLVPATLAKAFRGELVPQDPNDEPASELLARNRSRQAAPGAASKPKRGAPRGPHTKAKAQANMRTRNEVTPTHLTNILKERGALTAEALWTESQLDIDDFYDQLKDEEARGLLREKRGDSPTALRLLEAAA